MIDKCICHNKTFSKILEEMKELRITSLTEVKQHLKICNKCCLCNPYIIEMSKTGQTKFNNIL